MCYPIDDIEDSKQDDSNSEVRRLWVKTLTGKTIPMLWHSDWTIFDVKQSIEDTEGIPIPSQRLIYAGRSTEDQKFVIFLDLFVPKISCVFRLLTDYGVLDESTMFLVLRLRGGDSNSSDYKCDTGKQPN